MLIIDTLILMPAAALLMPLFAAFAASSSDDFD